LERRALLEACAERVFPVGRWTSRSPGPGLRDDPMRPACALVGDVGGADFRGFGVVMAGCGVRSCRVAGDEMNLECITICEAVTVDGRGVGTAEEVEDRAVALRSRSWWCRA